MCAPFLVCGGLLLRVATASEGSSAGAAHAAATGGRPELSRRIEAILGHGRRGHERSRLLRAACGTALASLTLAVACTTPSGSGSGSELPPATAKLPPVLDDARVVTPSEGLLEQAIGGASSLEHPKQAAAETMLDAWLAEDGDVVRALAIAIEVSSGKIVTLAGRDRTKGPTTGIDHAYPPGSTIKPLVIAAAIDSGVARADEIIDGEGGTHALVMASGEKRTITDVTPRGRMSLSELLAVSSNIGATKIGARLGSRGLLAMYEDAALALPIAELGMAAPGSPPTAVGEATHWARVSIGHDASVNPLRMALAYAALAAGGDVVAPRLRDNRPSVKAGHLCRPDTAQAVLRMMESVVSTEGTGALAHVDGLRVAGKTGTSDLADGGLYASFIGIVPADRPRYVVLIAAETRAANGSGGHTAAPRFARLVERAFR